MIINFLNILDNKSMQGRISIQESNSDKWTSVKTGEKINSSEKLNISNNAYVSLAYSTGKPIEIRSEGLYNFDNLKKLVAGNYKTSNKKFAELNCTPYCRQKEKQLY